MREEEIKLQALCRVYKHSYQYIYDLLEREREKNKFIYIYIHTYIEREREKNKFIERDRQTDRQTDTYIYIHIYIINIYVHPYT